MNEFKSENNNQSFQAERQIINLTTFVEKKKSVLADIVLKLSKIDLEKPREASYTIPLEYTIEDKIGHNNVVGYKWLIEDYGVYGKELDDKYDGLDEEAPGRKLKLFRLITDTYKIHLGRYQTENPKSELLIIIQSNADKIIHDVIEDLINKLLQSDNYDENITMEEYRISIQIIVAHAFIHCKILENPKKNDNSN